jgi:hypothetical protein
MEAKHDLRLPAWNIRTLNYSGALQNLKDQIRNKIQESLPCRKEDEKVEA